MEVSEDTINSHSIIIPHGTKWTKLQTDDYSKNKRKQVNFLMILHSCTELQSFTVLTQSLL